MEVQLADVRENSETHAEGEKQVSLTIRKTSGARSGGTCDPHEMEVGHQLHMDFSLGTVSD